MGILVRILVYRQEFPLVKKISQFTDTENKLMVTKEERVEGGIN